MQGRESADKTSVDSEKLSRKNDPQQNVYAMRGFSVGIKSNFLI